jgi:hypothetical protein
MVTQRNPKDEEIDRGLNMMQEFRERDSLSKVAACRYFCLMALDLNEFLYAD